MSTITIGNFLIYCIINAFTPGPGNIVALNTVNSYGVKRGRPLFLGLFTGYYIVQVLCAVFVFALGTVLPGVLGVMKYIGAAYILWLAVHIALSKKSEADDAESASFTKGVLLSLVNVKIYLFGITALTGYITDFSTAFIVLLIAEIIVATIGTVATATWIWLGTLIQDFYLKHFKAINIILALTLLECVYSILRT